MAIVITLHIFISGQQSCPYRPASGELVQHPRDSMLHIGNLTHLLNEVPRNCFRYTSFSCKLFLLSGSIETYYLQTGKLILELIQITVSAAQESNLLLVCTYRSHETDTWHSFILVMEKRRQLLIPITDIALDDLTSAATSDFIAETIRYGRK